MDKLKKQYDVKMEPNSPSIMQSIDVSSFTALDDADLVDIVPKVVQNYRSVKLEAPFQSLPLHARDESFLLIDSEENIKVPGLEEFTHLLDCHNDCKMKVVSIFGSSGDGKSHTFNHMLFRGKEVFKTSNGPDGGTQGVWAAWQPAKRLLCLDTPALHQPNTPTILLLKVLAISDVVIYRTRAERLPGDLYKFLGLASTAFTDHFKKVLQNAGHRSELGGPLSARGPAVIISHEPRHTAPLSTSKTGETPEEQILNRVRDLGMSVDGLGTLYYTPTPPLVAKNFSLTTNPLSAVLYQHLDNSAVRAARNPASVLESLKRISERFRGRLTCDVPCKACQSKCTESMGHQADDIKHSTDIKCRYQHQYENKIFVCQKCQRKVKEIYAAAPQESWLGLARSAWNGYELHCPKCGPVYRSRQYWYGNKAPEETAVNTEIVHVWQGISNGSTSSNGVGARRALEGVGNLTGALASRWLADTIAPSYWQPTSQIKNCCICLCALEAGRGELHHCRACGLGVCGPCSPFRRPVPQRGWLDPVRVCDACKDSSIDEGGDVTARKVGEAVAEAFGPLAVALQYPKGVLTNLARPTYWTPDEEAPSCSGCEIPFGFGSDCTVRHHCRRCGQSVCSACSPHRQAVPERGWGSPVRVCNACITDMLEKI